VRAVTDQNPDTETLLEPDDIARWLDVHRSWVTGAIRAGLPVVGYRSDGVPLIAAGDVRAWLRRPSRADDET
jgi:hypothetical protein